MICKKLSGPPGGGAEGGADPLAASIILVTMTNITSLIISMSNPPFLVF
jgi:hypothetical protein